MACQPTLIEPNGFTTDQAFRLLNQAVTSRGLRNPGIEDLGIVAGLLVLNDEPELVVKFIDRVEQYTRREFEAALRIVPEGE